MGRILVEQPNGLYADFSTVCDGFVITNATKEQIVESRLELHRQSIEFHLDTTIQAMKDIKAGKLKQHPYVDPTDSWDKLLKEHVRRHGALGEDFSLPPEEDGQ